MSTAQAPKQVCLVGFYRYVAAGKHREWTNLQQTLAEGALLGRRFLFYLDSHTKSNTFSPSPLQSTPVLVPSVLILQLPTAFSVPAVFFQVLLFLFPLPRYNLWFVMQSLFTLIILLSLHFALFPASSSSKSQPFCPFKTRLHSLKQ